MDNDPAAAGDFARHDNRWTTRMSAHKIENEISEILASRFPVLASPAKSKIKDQKSKI
jgi:hypothetical protein